MQSIHSRFLIYIECGSLRPEESNAGIKPTRNGANCQLMLPHQRYG